MIVGWKVFKGVNYDIIMILLENVNDKSCGLIVYVGIFEVWELWVKKVN